MAHKAPAIDPLASTSGIKIDTVYKLTRTLGRLFLPSLLCFSTT